MTQILKEQFQRALNVAVKPGLTEGKKLAIQISTLDGYWTLTVMLFYSVYSIINNLYPYFYFHTIFFSCVFIGLLLLIKGYYDFGRCLMQLMGLFEVFMATDAAGNNSGYEFYYFTCMAIPFITFSFEEQWKGNLLSAIASLVLLLQMVFGTGLIFPITKTPDADKLIALIFVVSYVLIVFTVARWQLRQAQNKIEEQQNELIHSSNLLALGEMAGGVAHEINNPLQTLTLQLAVLKKKYTSEDSSPKEIEGQLDSMNSIILKMGKMVQGLRDLSRKETAQDRESVLFAQILEDVLVVSGERLKELGITLRIKGDPEIFIQVKPVQMSQVLINLINNSADAIKDLSEKWITIDVILKNSFLQVSVTDSGKGIPEDLVEKIMRPFFTTKEPTKGTGLGLSISTNIMIKNEGRLFYDSTSPNTRFIMLMPLAPNPTI